MQVLIKFVDSTRQPLSEKESKASFQWLVVVMAMLVVSIVIYGGV
jgi:hypothetical protein